MISHRAITNRLLWMQTTFPLVTTDHLLQKTSISFDASVWELFTPLNGGRDAGCRQPRRASGPYLLGSSGAGARCHGAATGASMLRYF